MMRIVVFFILLVFFLQNTSSANEKKVFNCIHGGIFRSIQEMTMKHIGQSQVKIQASLTKKPSKFITKGRIESNNGRGWIRENKKDVSINTNSYSGTIYSNSQKKGIFTHDRKSIIKSHYAKASIKSNDAEFSVNSHELMKSQVIHQSERLSSISAKDSFEKLKSLGFEVDLKLNKRGGKYLEVKLPLQNSKAYQANPKLFTLLRRTSKKGVHPKIVFNFDNERLMMKGHYSAEAGEIDLGQEQLNLILQKKSIITDTTRHELRHSLFEGRRVKGNGFKHSSEYDIRYYKGTGAHLTNDKIGYKTFLSAEELYNHVTDLNRLIKKIKLKTVLKRNDPLVITLKSKIDLIKSISNTLSRQGKNIVKKVEELKKTDISDPFFLRSFNIDTRSKHHVLLIQLDNGNKVSLPMTSSINKTKAYRLRLLLWKQEASNLNEHELKEANKLKEYVLNKMIKKQNKIASRTDNVTRLLHNQNGQYLLNFLNNTDQLITNNVKSVLVNIVKHLNKIVR